MIRCCDRFSFLRTAGIAETLIVLKLAIQMLAFLVSQLRAQTKLILTWSWATSITEQRKMNSIETDYRGLLSGTSLEVRGGVRQIS